METPVWESAAREAGILEILENCRTIFVNGCPL